MFNDRDEFIHLHERHTNIKHFFNRHFDRPDLASITYWGSVYFVHCKVEQVGPLCLADMHAMACSSRLSFPSALASATASQLKIFLQSDDQVQVMDALLDHVDKEPEQETLVAKYWGYSAWDIDHRMPNFTGCGPLDCHPKSVVRPKVGLQATLDT